MLLYPTKLPLANFAPPQGWPGPLHITVPASTTTNIFYAGAPPSVSHHTHMQTSSASHIPVTRPHTPNTGIADPSRLLPTTLASTLLQLEAMLGRSARPRTKSAPLTSIWTPLHQHHAYKEGSIQAPPLLNS